MEFRDKLLKLIQDQGIGLGELASRTGLSRNTIRNYTRPSTRAVPQAPVGVVLARALNVPTDWLFDDSQDWPPAPRMESPPFEIRPWPPQGVTWEEVWEGIYVIANRKVRDLIKQAAEKPPEERNADDAKQLLTLLRVFYNIETQAAEDPRIPPDLASRLAGHFRYSMSQIATAMNKVESAEEL